MPPARWAARHSRQGGRRRGLQGWRATRPIAGPHQPIHSVLAVQRRWHQRWQLLYLEQTPAWANRALPLIGGPTLPAQGSGALLRRRLRRAARADAGAAARDGGHLFQQRGRKAGGHAPARGGGLRIGARRCHRAAVGAAAKRAAGGVDTGAGGAGRHKVGRGHVGGILSDHPPRRARRPGMSNEESLP